MDIGGGLLPTFCGGVICGPGVNELIPPILGPDGICLSPGAGPVTGGGPEGKL
jgi:orotidine-5'-phosphate decarboxylase